MDLPDAGMKLGFPALQVDSLPAELPGKPVYVCVYICISVCMYVKVKKSESS